MVTHPKSIFSKDYISALSGCCALKFLRATEWPLGTGVLSRVTVKIPKIGQKFSICTLITLGLGGVTSRHFTM